MNERETPTQWAARLTDAELRERVARHIHDLPTIPRAIMVEYLKRVGAAR